MLLLLCACRSGVIHYASGSDDLRTALFATADYALHVNQDGDAVLTQTVALLANSEVDCDTIPSLAAGKDAAKSPAAAALLTRENARVVIVFLFQQKDESLESTYEIEPGRIADNVTTSNGVASAAYLGVNESVLIDEEGLNRFYLPGSNPGDCELVTDVPSPGEIVVSHATASRLKGTFDFDSIDISGRFDATDCSTNPDFMTTLESVILLPQNLSMCVQQKADTPSGG